MARTHCKNHGCGKRATCIVWERETTPTRVSDPHVTLCDACAERHVRTLEEVIAEIGADEYVQVQMI